MVSRPRGERPETKGEVVPATSGLLPFPKDWTRPAAAGGPAAVPEVDGRAGGRRRRRERGVVGRGRGGVNHELRRFHLAGFQVLQIRAGRNDHIGGRDRHPQRARRPRYVRGRGDHRAAIDHIDAVRVAEDVDAVEGVSRTARGPSAREGEGRSQLVERRRGRVAHGCVCRGERRRDNAVAERRVVGRVRGAPGAVADRRECRRDLAVQVPHGSHAPANDPGVRRLLVESVELAVIDSVRPHADDLADVREPDLIAGRAIDNAPPRHARVCLDRLRQAAPADVQPKRGAPGADTVAGDRSHVGVDRVGLAGQPREGDGDRDGRSLELIVRPEGAGFAEARVLGELELVAHRAVDGQPGEGRRSRELVGDRFARPEQERSQAGRSGRAGGVGPCLNAAGGGERGKANHEQADRTHH